MRALCTRSHSSTQYKSLGATGGCGGANGPDGGEPGEDPEGVGLSPLPASKCTHSIPETPPDIRDNPVIDVDRPPVPGFSILYLRNSERLLSQ